MKTIAVYNIKGGVGKTATSVNLAYTISKDRQSTLLMDLDPQGASTFYFDEEISSKKKSKKMLENRKDIVDAILPTHYKDLDILPADKSFRKIDFIINEIQGGQKWLKKFLKPVKIAYDYAILDCPPNISVLSENVFNNADIILVPVVPTTLSIRTFEQLVEFFEEKNIDQKKIIPFFSMVEKRKALHIRLMKEFLAKYPNTINVGIPYLSMIEKMGEYKTPVTYQYPFYEASFCYKELWKELKKRISE